MHFTCVSSKNSKTYSTVFFSYCKVELVELFLTGIFLGIVLSHRVPEGRPLLFFFSFSIGLLLSALILHAGLQQLGIDLSWLVLVRTSCKISSVMWWKITCLCWILSIYSTGPLLWLRNGAAVQSGFAWTQSHSPLWLETVGPFWVWGWPSTGSLEDGLCLGLQELYLWLFHPWDCTTWIVCLSRSDHKASFMVCSLSNLS